VELFLGVAAEGKFLEDVASPLSVGGSALVCLQPHRRSPRSRGSGIGTLTQADRSSFPVGVAGE
jgi:hypothetical protein